MLFFIICASISLTLAIPVNNYYSLEDGPELFETFINEYNKEYEGEEKEIRFKIFLDNLKEINSFNEKSSNAVYGINMFTDLTNDEFIKTHTGFRVDENLVHIKDVGAPKLKTSNFTAPAKYDWRSQGVVSRVKNQGHCGSCWAFSATGNVESINAIKSGGHIVEISEQQLLDCDKKDFGCQGGFPHEAIAYLVQNGAMSSKSYPYSAEQGECHYDSNQVVVKIKNVEHILKISEEDIMEKLVTIGPLSIAIAGDILGVYVGGIIDHYCNYGPSINHAVLLVGYGQENGVDYWIVKNSWSPTFGEKGYFRMKRGVNCLKMTEYGIATAVI